MKSSCPQKYTYLFCSKKGFMKFTVHNQKSLYLNNYIQYTAVHKIHNLINTIKTGTTNYESDMLLTRHATPTVYIPTSFKHVPSKNMSVAWYSTFASRLSRNIRNAKEDPVLS